MSVHFIITLLLLVFWMWALVGPLKALTALYPRLADAESSQLAAEAIDAVAKSAGAVSALFTTVIGVVLGHYFGQRGVERAESGRARAEKLKEELKADLSDPSEALAETVVETLEDLSQQLDLRDAAIEQAVGLLEEQSAEVDSDSPLGRLLSSEEVSEEVADGEETDEGVADGEEE